MNKKVLWLILLTFICESWAVSRPMETIENYNILMVHGAYGSDKGIKANTGLKEADSTSEFLGKATLGSYTSDSRITKWLATTIFEEPDIGGKRNPSNAYIYNWRSFTNPANSSLNNAFELGNRKWNASTNGESRFGKRRALLEEAQEVKASFYDKNIPGDIYGQIALDSMRKYPDHYRQLASRYILIGHSMGGIVSREYVQGDFYNGDVDKIITLDSPHEGTGALNMQIYKEARGWTDEKIGDILLQSAVSMAATGLLLGVLGSTAGMVEAGMCISLYATAIAGGLSVPVTRLLSKEVYNQNDPLVHYVDPYQKGVGTINALNELPYEADSLPMFRLLGSKNSMTFGDPAHVDYGPLGAFYLENFSLPAINILGQLDGNGDASTIYANALTAGITGIVGIPLIEQGSSLVTESSGLGNHVAVLNDQKVDVRRTQFNAAIRAENGAGDFATAMGITSAAILALDFTLGLVNPLAAEAAKTGLMIVFSTTMGFSIISGAVAAGFDDLAESHMMPLYKKNLEKWLGGKNSFTSIQSGSSSYTPYLMEEFLYERPFVNLALNDIHTLETLSGLDEKSQEESPLNRNCYYIGSKESVNCAIGLFKLARDLNTTHKEQSLSGLTTPLRFKSESDWSKMGVKVDRWEMVDGLHPDGSENKKGVPIRHVERYEVPAITVEDWIEKYSFVVDDLMPHRLRQIRLNFNFVSEIAWECDITKPENDETACTVYKRSAGEDWEIAKKVGNQGKVGHPVKKNGRFDFNPRDYEYGNLFAIQKDNQNTVTISMVNKIGLSNTQRFYYLYKATDNVLKSNWPVRDVVLNRIEGFEAFASVANYQGFRVDSAYDIVFKDDDIEHGSRLKMTGTPIGAQDMGFVSRQQMDTLSDGQYAWQFKAYATNSASGDVDSAKFYNAIFSIDREVPKFKLYTDNSFVNPDSAHYIAHYRWNGIERTPDIRAMRWVLEGGCSHPSGDTSATSASCTEKTPLPALYDVATSDFAISWDKVSQDIRQNLVDGLYRVSAYALDYAVPSRLMYDSVNALVGRIIRSPSSLTDEDWKFVRDSSGILNDTTVYTMFRIDRTAPAISDIVPRGVYAIDTTIGYCAIGSGNSDQYALLPHPARETRFAYVAKDSLMEISYKIVEPLLGLDSAAVMVTWNFEHNDDALKVDRVGDSVWVKGNALTASWRESSGLRLSDGIYRIRAMARDRAGNRSEAVAPKMVRVDRTAPNIVSLVSRRLVYPDSDRVFSATINVNQSNDADLNRTGMYCYYRVSGGDADYKWHAILRNGLDSLLNAGTISFAIDGSAVGEENGKRYLEAVCLDAAGNASVRTDLFHVGFRSPNIVYPVSDETESSERLIPIVGVAPPPSSGDSLTAIYRLRYKKCVDSEWLSNGIDVVAANRRSDSEHNYSRISQSAEGVLGYLKNEGFEEDSVCVELAVASCFDCDDWKTDVAKVIVTEPSSGDAEERPVVVFDVPKSSFVAGDESVSVSLRLEGNFSSNYLLRVYAEDGKGVGLKDWSAQKVWRNPYYGEPSDSRVSSVTSGVWFYQDESGRYHLRWKNLDDNVGLQVAYDSKTMGRPCEGLNGASMASGCDVEPMLLDFATVSEVSKNYLEDFPELIPPSHVDSVMKVSAASGHIVLDARGAFRITADYPYGMDSDAPKTPVYFGESAQDGFYWVKGMDEARLSPLMTGWTVNPQGYGLNIVWDGLAETGAFPAGGAVKLVAEVTENTAKAPHVHVETKILDVKLPPLKVSLPQSLPDFLILNKDVDSDDSIAFHLDSMEIRYGIKNRDAIVRMYIKDPKGNIVTTLLDGVEHRSFVGDSSYSVRWSGKNAFETPSTAEGVYTVFLEAEAVDGSQTVTSSASFNMKYAASMQKMTPDDPKNALGTSVYVSEAQRDGDKYRYEPVADYLLQANMNGLYLPDSMRDIFAVKAQVSGTQKPIAFDAERFSLGILRQRDTLDLVILIVLDVATDKIACSENARPERAETQRILKKKIMRFIKGQENDENYVKDHIIDFFDSVSTHQGTGRALSINASSVLHVLAFPMYMKEFSEESLYEHRSMAYTNMTDFAYNMPIPARNHHSEVVGHFGAWDTTDDGCVSDSIHECVYSRDSTTEGYNPNGNLFKLQIAPWSTNKVLNFISSISGESVSKLQYVQLAFFGEKPTHGAVNYFGLGQIHNGSCTANNTRGFEFIVFRLFVDVPEQYWNAGFGYDNLVNRTIRFDATNQTIYGEIDGYLPALENESGLANNLRRNTYFDGSKWQFDKQYGRVTAFETQHLPFFMASEMDVATNTFLFMGETSDYESPSHFTVKFYGKDKNSHFVADLFAKKEDGSVYKQSLTSLTGDSIITPMLKHGNMDFYVSFNKIVSEALEYHDTSSAESWCGFPMTQANLPEGSDTTKYYAAGSRIHYYLGDYSDNLWLEKFSNGVYFKNLSNSVMGENFLNASIDADPSSIATLGLDESRISENSTITSFVKFDPDKYDAQNQEFYIDLGMKSQGEADLIINSLQLFPDGLNPSVYRSSNDTLYVHAQQWDRDEFIRRTKHNLDIPKPGSEIRIGRDFLYGNESWIKNQTIEAAKVLFLDSSEHSYFDVQGKFPSELDLSLRYNQKTEDRRMPEFVELRANLKGGEEYTLSYLNGNTFYTVPDTSLDPVWRNGIKPTVSGDYRLGWFNVNKLQGNTQFLLTWGDSKNDRAYFYSTFDMIVGRAAGEGNMTTVTSPLEDASVTFFEGSLTSKKDVTVRTINATDYPFEVFNNLALKGPIVEVLPSMAFENMIALPRIQMRVSREEMVAMHTSPQTIRLYKVDFTSKKFVPLENSEYGFLNADGSAVTNTPGGIDTLKCNDENKMTDVRCAGKDPSWAYLLISAETQTFSVFTIMDSSIAEIPNFSVTVLPEIAATSERTVRVDGLSEFRIYVDDDSLWANVEDETPPVELPFMATIDGYTQVTLPVRGNDVDTNFIFVVAEDHPAAPAVARALTVNVQFACSVPSDSLWLGLDNGYLAYGASCTHPGYGLMSLYKDDGVVAEIRGDIPDTIIYDGSKMTGASRIGKIASGLYDSRYVGVSSLGIDMQMAGPKVYTDSLRPAIRNFFVQDSAEVLDRIFTMVADVYDSESGVARVVVTPVFGDDTLRVKNVVPDSVGHVSTSIRISRKQLAECTGCYLSMEIRVEDYGHNHAEQKFASEKLYPYPAELALWYPAREGMGRFVHEFLGTGHDLDLFMRMTNPWRSDAGLYFADGSDYTNANNIVDFGSTPSYSFEARVKRGAGYSAWRRILGFTGMGGLNIELMQRGGVLKLVEGSHSWESELLPISEKSWAHVVVTVDSAHVKFYVDGELKKVRDSRISQERELEGVFSMGKTGSDPSYLGNIADIRMYSRALTAAEVEELSKPVTDEGEVSDVIVVAVKDMDAASGFSNEFSCSVAGNKYLVSGDSATLTMSVIVENAADYNVVLYARSATAGDKPVYVGESSLLAGTAAVSNTWRAVTVSGVSVHLAAGTHTLTLKVPAGIQIGGAALTTANIPASMIAWGESTSDKIAGIVSADTVRKIKSYLRYEGYPETSTLRPRIRLRNVSNEPLNGFSVRYYFRGEDAATAGVERYWPNNVETFPAVHSESANTGYVEWTFAETIPVAGTAFGGDGPHFGLYNADYTPWNASDDPSFVDPNSGLVANIDGFYEDAGVVVLDKDNNLIGGSCAEMEDPVSLETKVRVLASDMRGDNQASEIHFKVENTGNISLKNYDVRYYFFVEEGLAPDYELNDKSECASASMESLGSGRWQVTVHCDKPLVAGKTWQNPVKVALHLPGWAEMWNVNDDPSHDSLGTSVRETRGICVFDSTGYMLYGDVPVWVLPAPDEVSPDSAYHVDFGYHAPAGSIPIVRTPDGLVLTLDNWTYVELSLVTALGQPVKFIFNGTLAPGDQLVYVDWTGIDMGRTYLMLKVNGSIKSTKKLSLL